MTLHAEPPRTFPGYAVARHLCRLCLCSREQTARQRLNHVDWSKWPGAEITRLYERVVGEKMPVSAELSELHCDACLAWLEGTLLRIEEFRRVSRMWNEHLAPAAKIIGATAISATDAETKSELDLDVEVEELLEEEPETTADDVHAERREEEYIIGYGMPSEQQNACPVRLRCARRRRRRRQQTDVEELIEEEQELLEEQYTIANLHIENQQKQQPEVLSFEISEMLVDYENEEHLYDDQTSELFDDTTTVDQQPTTSFICDLCDATLHNKVDLLRHFESVHGFATCEDEEPGTSIATAAQLRTDTKTRLYACTLCSRRYMYEHLLRQHCEHTHPQSVLKDDRTGPEGTAPAVDKMLRCRYCRCEFTAVAAQTEASLHRRRREHYANECPVLAVRRQRPRPAVRSPMRCHCCTAAYLRPATLQKHYETAHSTDDWAVAERRMCVRCFRQFADETEADRHRRDVHERWRCTICGKLCLCAESLRRHTNIHSGKARKYKCSECDGTYVTANQLKTHYRRKHTAERPFECDWPDCEKRYAERGELNVHRRAAHGGEKHICMWCNVAFNSAKYLGTHVAKEHTGDFQYFECQTCGSQFVNTRLLNAHRAVHHADEVVANKEGE